MKHFYVVCALLAPLAFALTAHAHFQMIVPSSDVVAQDADRMLTLQLLFTHPMEGHLMHMARPVAFGVLIDGRKIDLLDTLKETTVGELSTWSATYRIQRPGDHVFYVEPAPYWEPAEEKFIVHYAKVVVNAFGLEEGWGEEVGLKTEIVPLVRPYGLWTGNVFRGLVKRDGQPVPWAEIEVEYYNAPGQPRIEAPTEAHITQVIKADGQGVFTYAMPRAGWWGFAALTEGDETLEGPDGAAHPVELGAVIWVHVVDMR